MGKNLQANRNAANKKDAKTGKTHSLKPEHHPLEPFLPKRAKLLMLGSFPPPPERWTMNFYYPNFQNDMWRIFGVIFFNNKDYFVAAGGKSFEEALIRQFLAHKGIALYDTAEEIIRQKGNASDQFLEIVKPVDLKKIMSQIPVCDTIVTTGQKATETLMEIMGIGQTPSVCGSIDTNFMDRKLRCYRMPSSSRAYPKSLIDKAADYRKMFSEANLL
jgi:G:T/U-mismatch repair DNA glycosylase